MANYVPAHRATAGGGLQAATEVEVLMANAVNVTVDVDVCFKNGGRTAFKMGLKKMRFPATGCAFEPGKGRKKGPYGPP